MSRRLHDFPQSYKGETRFNQFIDFTSAILLAVGIIVWMLLASTIGLIIPIAAHAIGFLLTASLYLVYTIRIPSEYYNKLGNERLYKLIYATLMHKRKKVLYSKSVGGDQ